MGRMRDGWLWLIKRTLNRLTLRLARSGRGPFSIVCSVGRRSGARYETPIMVARVPQGFVAELTYGPQVNWYRNIVAAGGCELLVGGRTHRIVAVEPFPAAAGRRAFGFPARLVLAVLRREEFRLLREREEDSRASIRCSSARHMPIWMPSGEDVPLDQQPPSSARRAMLGRKRARAADHEERVVDDEDIVRAASELLRTEGLLAITASRLAAAARVPETRFDVDAVVAQAYRETTVAEIAEVRRFVLANPSPVEQMRALLSWLSTAPEDSDAVRLEAWACCRRNPGLRSAVQDSEAAWHGLVASVIRRGARSGEFPQADADDIAAHVISLVDGINAYQLIGYRSDFDRMRLLTRVVQAELGMIWGPKLADALA